MFAALGQLPWQTIPMAFGVLVYLVDSLDVSNSTVSYFGGLGGHVHWRQSCCWRPSFGGLGQRAGGVEHARRAGAGIGRPANQSCASRPPLSSPVHLCPISPPALTPLASPWSCRAPAPPPCPAGMHLWPSEAAVWVVQLLSGRAVFHE